ncbi:tail fiber protein, partial [Xenorhabdus sp. 12]
NLGLTGTELPVGVPVPWPLATPPAGWLKCNGSAFSRAECPKLAQVYPSGVLPDLRGEFLRGWDGGRGVDNGRSLLSTQASTVFSEYAGNFPMGSGHAIHNHDGVVSRYPGFSRFALPSPVVGDGVDFVSIRPQNIAFNYIVRAV